MAHLVASELLRRLNEYDPKPTGYFQHGADRIARTIELLPRGEGKVLELGCDCHFSLSLALFTGYEVVPQNSPIPIAAPEDVTNPEVVFTKADGAQKRFNRLVFDVERGRFPFEDNSFAGILCCELIEHLFHDPSWMLSECNRILQPGGWIFLTTPNLSSYHAVRRAAQGIHPMEHSFFFRQDRYKGLAVQHTREFVFEEILYLLRMAGFAIENKWTFTFSRSEQLGLLEYAILLPAIVVYNVLKMRHPKHLLLRYRKPHTFVLARKVSAPVDRYPNGIYYQ
jgi:SAM-dependent methyltransferase